MFNSKHTLTRIFTALLLFLLTALPAQGFDKLSEAQSWVYDTGHLANTSEGQSVRYVYTSSDTASNDTNDAATLKIVKSGDEGRRDVELEFLTAERHLPLPEFTGYRGNPVIIAMLEHVAQSIGAETGGGVLYFRNRIRDALASNDVVIETGAARYADQEISTTTLTFSPFANDTYLENESVFREAQFNIQFSEQVPAGLVQIAILANTDDQTFNRILAIE